MKLRVKFKKYGAVRFIGHLDIMRFFQKCIRRAEIDIAYSSGYSPHQIMSFAAPLSVGLESNGEYMDIEVYSILSSDDIVIRLNEASTPGIEIISATVLPDNAKNAMASVAAAKYSIKFRDGYELPSTFADDVIAFSKMTSIVIEKQTKKNTLEIDLRPGIFDISFQNNTLTLLVDASSSGNIKPQKVIETIAQINQYTIENNMLLITREDTFLNLGTVEQPKLVPLDDIGEIVYA